MGFAEELETYYPRARSAPELAGDEPAFHGSGNVGTPVTGEMTDAAPPPPAQNPFDPIGNALRAPSEDARRSYQQIVDGWCPLIRWGAAPGVLPYDRDCLPSSVHDDVFHAIAPDFDDWQRFRTAWETGETTYNGGPITGALSSQAQNLTSSTLIAKEYGYPGDYHDRRDLSQEEYQRTAAEQVHAPDVTESTGGLQAAAATKRAADAGEAAAKQAAKALADTAKGALDPIANLPWWGKILLGVGIVGAAAVGLKLATAPVRAAVP